MHFNTHYKMTRSDIIEYVFKHTDFFTERGQMVCDEIGDGNINYVYRIKDTVSGQSVIVKQADIQTRVRPDGYLNPERSVLEASALKQAYLTAPEFVPEVFFSDKTMALIIMEDIGSYTNLKKLLMTGKIPCRIGAQLAQFIVKTELPLTEIVCGYEKKAQTAARFYNPELCKITEDLVFTHPYLDERKRNILLPENKNWLETQLYTDEMRFFAACLKERFCSYPQSLIHGDLHSGSIFVKNETGAFIKIIDPEFACFAPIGYDLGNVLAHLIFAEKYALFLRGEPFGESTVKTFLLKLEHEKKALFDVFTEKASSFLRENARGIYKNDAFIEHYIVCIKKDALAFAGAELNRRVIGSAKTAEITGIPDKANRIEAERELVKTGIKLIRENVISKNTKTI